MEKVWKNNFKARSEEFPNEIAIEYCNQLYELTNKLVMAKVEKYDKNIENMEDNMVMNLSNFSPLLRKTTEQYLGEISENNKFTYEMFLTGINTPNYKYRFCFIENGVKPYPVRVVLDTDIANELEFETKINCNNRGEYIELLLLILNSKKMTEVIEGLMAINLRMS